MFKIFNKKYKYFKSKFEQVQREIWNLDFKIAKSRQVREGIRQDRDHALNSLNAIETALKEKKTPELEKDKASLEDNVKRYEAQMKMIDEQIEGGFVSDENPAGIGIKEQMKSLAELRNMYEDYLKKL